MPINQSMFESLQPGVNDMVKGDQAAKLAKYLQAQEPAIAGQKQGAQNEANLRTLLNPQLQGQVNEGGSAKVGDISVGGNPYAKMAMQGPHQAQAFLKTAQGAYKDINSNLDAAQTTLDNLNLGNSAGDKAAAISEAKLMLNGGRGIPSIVPMLSGDPTMATDAQKAMNWLQNTPNVPTLQPAQRDALREMVFSRNQQTAQQHQQTAAQLAQQGPLVAPQADYAGLTNSFVNPAQQKLDRINKMQSEYQAQRAKMQPQSAVSQPSTASPNPTTLDKLKTLFSRGSAPQAPQQAPTNPQAGPPPGMSFEQYKAWKAGQGN